MVHAVCLVVHLIKALTLPEQLEEGVCVGCRMTNEVELIENSTELLKVALLDQSDLFLMPSIKYKKSVEGFGISFIEAAAYCSGSIGGKVGGASDAIKDGETGYLCDGESLDEIYSSIIKFYDNNNFIRLGENAFKFSKNFHWDKIVKKYIDLI